MKILTCPPTLAGFLTAVYHAYYSYKDAEKIISAASPRDFLNDYIEIDEDLSLAERVKSGIIKKTGKAFCGAPDIYRSKKLRSGCAFYDDIADAFRSCSPEKESIIFEFLKLFFKEGAAVFERYDLPETIAFYDILRKVKGESSQIRKFIRLKEMSNGVYYGYFSSDNDVLELVTDDYAACFNTQRFVLHDYKRKKMAYFDGKKINFSPAPELLTIELSDSETAFQALWKQYHKNVSIFPRENLKLQRAFAPKKYRHFMNEFE